MTRVVEIRSDAEAMSRAAADALVQIVARSVEAAGRCTIALAGGSTPARVYALLATEHRDAIPWDAVHLFFGDERLLPRGHEDRNESMARTELIDQVPIPEDHVHPMPGSDEHADATEAARAYEARLAEFFGNASEPPSFDLVLLGLGGDGHTASLFPGDSALVADGRHVAGVERSPTPPHVPSTTLTLPVLDAARAAYFLVAGSSKREVVASVLGEERCSFPAALVRPEADTVWYLDQAAS